MQGSSDILASSQAGHLSISRPTNYNPYSLIAQTPHLSGGSEDVCSCYIIHRLLKPISKLNSHFVETLLIIPNCVVAHVLPKQFLFLTQAWV